MAIILRLSPAGGKRVHIIAEADADAMVEAGDAMKFDGHSTPTYEEITPSERTQGYLTRNMIAIPPLKAKKLTRKERDAQAEDSPGAA